MQQCENCKREFTKKSNLTRHKRNCIGVGELPFVCDSCSKAFHSQKSLDCHIRQVHKVSAETAPELSQSTSVSTASQQIVHSVCIFVSCRGDETMSTKDSDFGASQVERNCFGGVLLALCTFHGTGDARATSTPIVSPPQSLHKQPSRWAALTIGKSCWIQDAYSHSQTRLSYDLRLQVPPVVLLSIETPSARPIVL